MLRLEKGGGNGKYTFPTQGKRGVTTGVKLDKNVDKCGKLRNIRKNMWKTYRRKTTFFRHLTQ